MYKEFKKWAKEVHGIKLYPHQMSIAKEIFNAKNHAGFFRYRGTGKTKLFELLMDFDKYYNNF